MTRQDGQARAVLRLRFPDSGGAERSCRSLAADDDGHLAMHVEGAVLVLESRSKTALGLLRTLDDALGCLRAAEPDL